MDQTKKRSQLAYSVGCIGRDMVFILVSMFVLTYIQYTMNLTVAQFSAISGIMIFARVFDAINDPVMGMIIDNSNMKSGKYRPWILIGGISNFIVTILLFTLRPSGWMFVLFFGVFYLSWGITYTINDISYWSLLTNLAKSNDERNKLTNLVLVFASIGQFVSGGLIPILVTGNAVFMYKLIAIVVSLVFLASTLLTYFGVTENKYENKSEEKIKLKDMYKIIFNNDQLLVVAIVLLLQTIATELFLAFGINFFYFEFGYGGAQMTIFTVFFALGTIVALAVFPMLISRFKRMEIIRVGVIISIIGYLCFLSLGYLIPMNETLLYLSAFLIFFGQKLFFTVLIIMTANTIEYNEYKTGNRNESVIFSIRPFTTKLGAALQQGVVTLVLIVSGIYTYSQQVAQLEIDKALNLIGDITQSANAILANATSEMLLILRIGMVVIPLISVSIAYLVIKNKYIITEEMHDEMVESLKNK